MISGPYKRIDEYPYEVNVNGIVRHTEKKYYIKPYERYKGRIYVSVSLCRDHKYKKVQWKLENLTIRFWGQKITTTFQELRDAVIAANSQVRSKKQGTKKYRCIECGQEFHSKPLEKQKDLILCPHCKEVEQRRRKIPWSLDVDPYPGLWVPGCDLPIELAEPLTCPLM